jgi:serine/threonine protein kinase
MPFLAGRYRFVRTLGTGLTARTIVCEDLFRHREESAPAHGSHPLVVLKIFSSKFYAIGEQESERMRRLNAADPRAEQRVVRQLGRFVFEGRHIVIVLPLLRPMLGTHPHSLQMPLRRVRHLCAHVLLGLAFLHSEGVIHADIKPDNIMLDGAHDGDDASGCACCGARAAPSEPPLLIDLGNACTPVEARSYADGALQTLPYRSPELIYGLPGVSYAIDMWSVGCLLYELACGQPLFRPTSAPHMALEIAELLGQPPPAYAAATRTSQIAPRIASCDPTRARAAVALAVSRRLLVADARSGRLRRHADQLLRLSDLIASALDYDPAQRVSARGALLHPFMGPFFPLQMLMPSGRSGDGARPVANPPRQQVPAHPHPANHAPSHDGALPGKRARESGEDDAPSGTPGSGDVCGMK